MTATDFEKSESLSEEEKNECARWSDEDWFNYFVSKGTITLNEFCEKIKEATYKIANEKYGCKIKHAQKNGDTSESKQITN